MKKLYKLKDRLMEVLEQMADEAMNKSAMNLSDIEMIHKVTDTIKNLDKIFMLEDGGGYSEASDGRVYGQGSSYANRGEHWIRGHYSRNDGRDGEMSGGNYSFRRDEQGRYSRDGGKSVMMEHLERALDSANEQDRENIKRFMREMDRA